MADSLSTRARALLEADGKARYRRERLHDLSKEIGSACPLENPPCPTCWPEMSGLSPRNDAPDIAKAYLEAVAVMRRMVATGDNFTEMRAWLAKWEGE